MRDVGRRLAELREERGWSQEQFAERLGVTTRYLARLEGGKQNLTIHRLAWLANELAVRVALFFEAPRTREVRRGRPPKSTRA